MADLIAQGTDPADRWRRTLPVARGVVLGRAGEWSVPWDPAISRRHVELAFVDGTLHVRKLVDARNPVFHRGRLVERLTLRPAEHFVIGDTSFTLLDDHVAVTLHAPLPELQETFTSDDLKRLRFRDAQGRIEVLSRLGQLIAEAIDESELHSRVVNVLLVGIPTAAAAALLTVDPATLVGDAKVPASVATLQWDRRRLSPLPFTPSQRLIVEAVRAGQSILHVWRGGGQSDFTVAGGADWALAAPLPGETCRGQALYVEGRFDADAHRAVAAPAAADIGPLREDVKFAELVAATVASWCDNQRLRDRQAALRPFFSPAVLSAIARDDPKKVLAPREADVTVMFCDLRGFSRASQQSAHDLMGLLQRVSRALGVSTQQILDNGGVVGDFQGDAVMGFWGWPIPEPQRAELACRAALGIQRQCQLAADEPEHPLADFRVGIGIATGRAVAGQIGTDVQAKVTVFGPVPNLASRLEGLTRLTGTDILLDEGTVSALVVSGAKFVFRTSPVAVMQPYGMGVPGMVCRLLPSAEERPEITDEALTEYRAALTAFRAGQWDEARARLAAISWPDPAADYLRRVMDEHGGAPPPDFDGVIRLKSK